MVIIDLKTEILYGFIIIIGMSEYFVINLEKPDFQLIMKGSKNFWLKNIAKSCDTSNSSGNLIKSSLLIIKHGY